MGKEEEKGREREGEKERERKRGREREGEKEMERKRGREREGEKEREVGREGKGGRKGGGEKRKRRKVVQGGKDRGARYFLRILTVDATVKCNICKG